MSKGGDEMTRSGSPISQSSTSMNGCGGGMSAGSPCGAPRSTQRAIVAISSSLSDQSSLNFWMPMFRSMYHGGMTPGLSRSPVRFLMARAQGRTSSYEMSDIGASASGRWHF